MHPQACAESETLRLVRLLEHGSGHLAVWALEAGTARAAARRALLGIDAAAVLNLSALHLLDGASGEAAESDARGRKRRGRKLRDLLRGLLDRANVVDKFAFILVEDAAAADASALDSVRRAVECTPGAVQRLRIILIGDERLLRTLDDPAASTLAGCIGARIHIPRNALGEHAPNTTRPAVLDYAAFATLSLGLVALLALPYLPGSTPSIVREPEAHASATDEASTSAILRAGMAGIGGGAAAASADTRVDSNEEASLAAPGPPSVPAAIEPSPVVDEPNLDEAPDLSSRPHAHVLPAVSRSHAMSTLAPRFAPHGTVDGDRMFSRVQAHESFGPLTGAADSAAADDAPMTATGILGVALATPASAPAKRAPAAKEKSEDGVAHSEPKPSLGVDLSSPAPRSGVVQAAIFRDAKSAAEARRRLEPTLGRVVIARVEGESAPLYSVRVVGLQTSGEVEDAESQLRRLGYEPKRFGEPTRMARFSRRLQPLWASLF